MVKTLTYIVECMIIHAKLAILILLTVAISLLLHWVKQRLSKLESALLYCCSVTILTLELVVIGVDIFKYLVAGLLPVLA